jgi:hypothetical protein
VVGKKPGTPTIESTETEIRKGLDRPSIDRDEGTCNFEKKCSRPGLAGGKAQSSEIGLISDSLLNLKPAVKLLEASGPRHGTNHERISSKWKGNKDVLIEEVR